MTEKRPILLSSLAEEPDLWRREREAKTDRLKRELAALQIEHNIVINSQTSITRYNEHRSCLHGIRSLASDENITNTRSERRGNQKRMIAVKKVVQTNSTLVNQGCYASR